MPCELYGAKCAIHIAKSSNGCELLSLLGKWTEFHQLYCRRCCLVFEQEANDREVVSSTLTGSLLSLASRFKDMRKGGIED